MKRFYVKWQKDLEKREAAPCELLKDGYYASGDFLFKVPKEKIDQTDFFVWIDTSLGCCAIAELFTEDPEMTLEKFENNLRAHVKERLQYFLEQIG